MCQLSLGWLNLFLSPVCYALGAALVHYSNLWYNGY